MGLKDHRYDFFELEYLNEFPTIWLRDKDLVGVNVTVPHKENVKRFLDRLDVSAIKVGAVNVVHRQGRELVGYNSDYIGFKQSLSQWLDGAKVEALVLGTGGSSKAVQAALTDLNIDHELVSRKKGSGDITYGELNQQPELIKRYQLIVNTTPLGMHPNVEQLPELPYKLIGEGHYLFDLVYNPGETAFMKAGKQQGAKTKNGLEMLHLQAEKSWEIWKS